MENNQVMMENILDLLENRMEMKENNLDYTRFYKKNNKIDFDFLIYLVGLYFGDER